MFRQKISDGVSKMVDNKDLPSRAALLRTRLGEWQALEVRDLRAELLGP
jgi:hypothetical protein